MERTPFVAPLPDVIQSLLSVSAYPEPTNQVELVQTHISYLLLTDNYVYKIKKPVDFGFVDYTTLERRQRFCQEEVRLNARLCPETYLGVVAINRVRRSFRIEGPGRVAEYAVKMRRLPRERMMDHLLARGEVTSDMVRRVAQRLAHFHAAAETGPEIAAYGSPEVIAANAEENFVQTQPYVDRTVAAEDISHIEQYTRGFLRDARDDIIARTQEGRIRDCHGDVHSQHVCFTDGICIYDCIEFNERFRYCDVASEVAFLAMDLDHHRRPDLAATFVDAYQKASLDRGISKLMDFYKGYRAYVRGKVESFRLDDRAVSEEDKHRATEAAGRYFDLAAVYAGQGQRPRLVVTTGLLGTGKSALAEGLAHTGRMAILSSDVIRKELANLAPTERRYEGFDTGIYSPDFSRRTYDELFGRARRHLSDGVSVILDASFRSTEERRRAKELATEMGADFWIVETTCPEDIIHQRLQQREQDVSVSDGRWAIFHQHQASFQPVAEVAPPRHVVIDMSQRLVDALAEATFRVLRQIPSSWGDPSL